MITAQSKHQYFTTELLKLQQDLESLLIEFKSVVQTDEEILISDSILDKYSIQHPDLKNHLINQFYAENKKLLLVKKQISNQQYLPELSFNYFNSKDVTSNQSYNSFKAGISVPVLFFGKSARIKASKIDETIAKDKQLEADIQLKSKYAILQNELKKASAELTFYNENGRKLASEILKTADSSFKNGEIDFFQYIQSIENSNQLNISYLNSLNNFNQKAIEINYINL